MWRCSVRRICRQHVRPVPTPRCRSYPRQSPPDRLCRSAPRTWSASARDKWHSLADFTVRPTATASCARVRARLRKSSNSRRAFASSAPTTRYVESINCAITASTARVSRYKLKEATNPAGSGPVTVPTATTVSGTCQPQVVGGAECGFATADQCLDALGLATTLCCRPGHAPRRFSRPRQIPRNEVSIPVWASVFRPVRPRSSRRGDRSRELR